MEVNIEVNETILSRGCLWWARLDACHVDPIFVQNFKCFIEDTGLIIKREQDSTAILHIPELDSIVRVALAGEDVCQLAHTHHATEVGLRLGKDKTARLEHVTTPWAHRLHGLVVEGSELLHLEQN